MSYIQLRCSHRHLLPLAVLYVLVTALVDMGSIVSAQKEPGLQVYMAYTIVVAGAVAEYYLIFVVSLLFEPRLSFLGLRNSDRTNKLLIEAAPFLTYFFFVGRIALLCFLEAFSVGLLAATIIGVKINPVNSAYWVFPLAAVSAAIHVWIERPYLGKRACARVRVRFSKT